MNQCGFEIVAGATRLSRKARLLLYWKRLMDPFNHTMASQLHQVLQQRDHRIVFAESCTSGLIAASLGQIPGISKWMAGSAVVYQIETKTEWLKVDRTALRNSGPVSQTVSDQMARSVLQMTPQATIAASVTGHLGPNAPAGQDGVAWSSIAVQISGAVAVTSRLLHLDQGMAVESIANISPIKLRQVRQICAVRQVLQFCMEHCME